MKRTITFALTLALCGLLSSCKKPISGQISIVTQGGVDSPLAAIEVETISGKDADDFMRHRQIEIENKVHSLQDALSQTKIKYAACMNTESQARAALMAAEVNEKAYGPKYAALQVEKAKDLHSIDQLTTNIDDLNFQLDQGKSPGASAISVSQRNETYSSLQTAEDSSRQLRGNVARIDGQLVAIKNNFLAPYRKVQASATRAVVQADAGVTAAAKALKRFPTANDYFDGFSPNPIETTVTDADGNFVFQQAKSSEKIYAKAQRQTGHSVENYYWLVDLRATHGKLVLSNDNLFSVSGAVSDTGIAGR